jgi:Condensation domain
VLLLTFHHAIIDGMSLPMLSRDLAAAYSAALHDSAPQWSPSAVSFIDYAAWQRQHWTDAMLEVSDDLVTAQLVYRVQIWIFVHVCESPVTLLSSATHLIVHDR